MHRLISFIPAHLTADRIGQRNARGLFNTISRQGRAAH